MKTRIHPIVIITAAVILLIATAVLLYLNIKYHKLDSGVESITIVLNKPFRQNRPTAYLLDSTEALMMYENPIASKVLNDSILFFDLTRPTKLRRFRIYFAPSLETITIKAIRLRPARESDLDIKTFETEGLEIIKKEKEELSFKVLARNGYSYIESSNFYYPSDYPFIVLSVAVIIVASCFLFYFSNRGDLFHFVRPASIQTLSITVFMISIFLPQRFFNIALIISILLHIRNFKMKPFLANKMNLYFVALCAIIFINVFVIFSDYNFKAVEKYTLLLVLPIFLSCIRIGRPGNFLCFSTIAIGGVLLFRSLIDVAIFRNLEIISFENFTGSSIHPVYYSYLIAFSIIYVQFTISHSYKYIIQLFLVLLLIFCGSKLIIISTLLLVAFQLRKQVTFVLIPLAILSALLFPPLKNRIQSIIDPNDLSIIHENPIPSPHDPRLNGLTIRMILWQESLHINDVKNLLFGRGAGLSGDKYFQQRLERRGLQDHLSYNSHNQFITTLYETGLVGLIILLSSLAYLIRWAMIKSDRVLLTFTTLMCIAMLSESVLEKASGIALFCTVILSLMNTKIFERMIVNKEIAKTDAY